MNRKQLIILLVALVVLGGASLALLKHNQDSWTSSGDLAGHKLFDNFQVNDAAVIHIKGEDDLNLEKKNDRWSVRERDDYPANFSQVSELLIKMGDLKIAQAEPIDPAHLSQMHLAEPGPGPNAATLLEFKDGKGKVLASVELGKKHTQKSTRPSPFPGANDEYPDGRFVMLKSDPHEILTVSDPLNSVESKPAGWLDQTFFKVEKPASISFTATNAADSWTITRASEDAPWVLSNAKGTNEVLDTNKVVSLASTLSYPRFVDVTTGGQAKTAMEKPQVITITTFDHFTYTIKVGTQTSANNYNVNISVAANFPTERVAGKDEKPDDKKKLDKVFQDNLKPLQDKLHQEEALNKWVYQVNSWSISPFIRRRSELMVDKNAEKKKDEKKVAAAPGALPTDQPDDVDMAIPPVDGNDK
jgi:hypothetical protein